MVWEMGGKWQEKENHSSEIEKKQQKKQTNKKQKNKNKKWISHNDFVEKNKWILFSVLMAYHGLIIALDFFVDESSKTI